MKTQGYIKSITQLLNKKYQIMLEVDKIADFKQDILYSVEIKQHKEKRSIDANSYFHLLVSKLADERRISKPFCKNIIIGRYGQPDEIDGEQIIFKSNISADKMLEQETLHLLPINAKYENGKEVYFYRVYRGSHTYDTREMSILIDGLISECKEQGIETLTPDELARMKGYGNG